MTDDSMQERADRWASTMRGAEDPAGVRLAHADSHATASGVIGRRARCPAPTARVADADSSSCSIS